MADAPDRFVSNSDNLGATLDTDLLQFFATGEAPFVMEVGAWLVGKGRGRVVGWWLRPMRAAFSDGVHLW